LRAETPDHNKAAIMMGLMLLERAIIAKSYNENIFEITTQDLKATKHSEHSNTYRGSLYFRCLALNMGLEPKNTLDYEDYQFFLKKAKLFIESHAYHNGSSKEGFKKEHPFSESVIPELDLCAYLDTCISVSAEAGHRIIERNQQKQAEELRKEPKKVLKKPENTSWFGGLTALWFSAPSDTAVITQDSTKENHEEPNTVFQPR
jgi:hypothetical protein